MTPERFAILVDAYGGTPERWPAAERDAARAYLAATPTARALVDEARRLDALLDRLELPAVAPDIQRIAARAMEARQEAPSATVIAFKPKAKPARPAWQWARAAALAAAGICGLIVGMENAGDTATRNTGTAVELYDAAAADDLTW